ncbi:FAD-dependent oxidoreductase [Chitinophaga qingshengii]|uniref:FAD-dependent monooxygenase n=1 Tax=Chitinophaga qingshengii TaxID=1569794 RepID=A0ABR7TY91_9BACT|nr:NAD(P)/FAD-dependent oxidoreductase [Chitinophaga qingshengii]MBC9934692.1 FAD-dependent monooxygenase [Chitinophaga qingshengii]
MKQIKVIVAGAGLGGLCLAQGLQQRGIDFLVFEKDAAFDSRTQGYRIRIDHAGQQALSACLPSSLYAAFENSSAQPAGVYTLDTRMQALTDKWVDQWIRDERDIPADLKADRQTLRRILMTGIEDKVFFNKDITGYSTLPDNRIKCMFADGETCEADLLVIANGASSSLTASCFPGTTLHDTGGVCVYGKIPLGEQQQLMIGDTIQQGTNVIFNGDIAAIIDVMQFKAKTPEDYIYWALIGKRGCFGLEAEQSLRLSPQMLEACIHQVSQSFSPALIPLFTQTAVSAMSIVPIRHSVQGERSGPSPVTVMGDAIHTMSPAAGLGANTALRDAAVLAENIVKVANSSLSLTAAITDYEHQMLTYSSAAIAASIQGSKLLYNAGN